MTDQQPIRFRTYADEDDSAWEGRARSGAFRRTANPAFDAADESVGALPPAPAPPTRGPAFLAWGAGLALVAGVAIAVTVLPKPGAVSTDEAATAGALHVHRYVASQPDRLAASALLPCYVDGASVGNRTLADCGRRNGVASGQLDVGLNPAQTAPSAARFAPPPAPRAPTPVDTYQDAAPFRQRQPAIERAVPTAPISRGSVVPLAIARATPPALVRTMPERPQYAPPPRAYAYEGESRADDERPDPEDSVRAAQTFYEGLADGDGARAASVVVPEKRRQGPLSAGAIDRFYSGLREPLHLSRLYPVDDHTVVARYDFVGRDGSVCQGTARVTTTQRDGAVYVSGVRAMNGC